MGGEEEENGQGERRRGKNKREIRKSLSCYDCKGRKGEGRKVEEEEERKKGKKKK